MSRPIKNLQIHLWIEGIEWCWAIIDSDDYHGDLLAHGSEKSYHNASLYALLAFDAEHIKNTIG